MDPDLRASAVAALGELSKPSDSTGPDLRALVNAKEYFGVVRAAMRALANWDADGNLPLFRRAATWESRNDVIRQDAVSAVGRSKADDAGVALLEYTKPKYGRAVRLKSLFLLDGEYKNAAPITAALIPLLEDEDDQVARSAANVLGSREDHSALQPLRAAEKNSKSETVRKAAKSAADKLEKAE